VGSRDWQSGTSLRVAMVVEESTVDAPERYLAHEKRKHNPWNLSNGQRSQNHDELSCD